MVLLIHKYCTYKAPNKQQNPTNIYATDQNLHVHKNYRLHGTMYYHKKYPLLRPKLLLFCMHCFCLISNNIREFSRLCWPTWIPLKHIQISLLKCSNDYDDHILYKCAFIIASSYYCLILFNFLMTVDADDNVLNNRMLECL